MYILCTHFIIILYKVYKICILYVSKESESNTFMQQQGSASSPESSPAADYKSFKSIHRNHLPILFPPLTAADAAGSAGAASGGGCAASGAASRSPNTAAPKERQRVFSWGHPLEPTVSTIHCAAMDLSWYFSQECWLIEFSALAHHMRCIWKFDLED